ncbi:MAG: acylphosphatase [Candidatus Nitrosocaldus sp.]
MSLKKIRAHVYVKGKVQGVYFRQNMRNIARKYNVHGWVRNLKDGRVEAVLEGDEDAVHQVIEWCHIGPSGARVDDVDVVYEEYRGEFNSFEILY